MNHRQKLRELEIIWYQKLADETDFEDIEDVFKKGRPLKEWHSLKFRSQRSKTKQLDQNEYALLVEKYNSQVSFEDIGELVVFERRAGGWEPITKLEAEQIWMLHLEGLTERKIAQRLNRSKTGVHGVIQRILEWLKVI